MDVRYMVTSDMPPAMGQALPFFRTMEQLVSEPDTTEYESFGSAGTNSKWRLLPSPSKPVPWMRSFDVTCGRFRVSARRRGAAKKARRKRRRRKDAGRAPSCRSAAGGS
jgi:hypothetical protein